jgi:peptidoglycan/LPS O-acetylase OafA/YrhL
VSRSLSVYLDLQRFLAALAVFLLHASFERFSGGLPVLWRFAIFGNDAVMLFFVLSGFVIAHVATREAAGPRGYAAARLARLWSVCVPALLLTMLVDGIGIRLAPQLYDFSWYEYSHPVGRTVASLLFANELWFWSLQPFSNTPYWSVGYEFWYYVLFGAWLFTRGQRRWLACGLVALVMGPKIMLLLPVWLAGVWAYRTPLAQRLSPVAAGALCVGTLAGYLAYRDSALPQQLAQCLAQWLGDATTHRLGWSANFLANYLVGVLVALHFVGARRLLLQDTAVPQRLERGVRLLAGFTFALYLFHNPLLQFFGALAHWLGWWEHRMLPVILGPLLVVWLLGARTERLKSPLKAALLRAVSHRARAG